MAPLLEDPRFRQTWNQFSQNAEEATETAATSIWTFQHQYINPCFASIASHFEACTGQCFPERDERARRLRERARTRGRAELSFDFYDDWDEDDAGRGGGLLGGWGNDELDRLLAGSGSKSGGGGSAIDKAPRRKRGMSYGTRGNRKTSLEADPTVIPSTNTLGFLGRLPFKLGGTLRYKPSAADLQEHLGASREEFLGEEGEPLITEDDEEEGGFGKGHRRQRSSTTSSGETSDSFRSRGDLFPSDGEDDAVPLDDEFAMVLERRMTSDERSSGKGKHGKGKRPAGSRTLSRTVSRTTNSSVSRPTFDGHRSSSAASLPMHSDSATPDMVETPTLPDLQLEEERIQREEDEAIERKRNNAIRLAVECGLHAEEAGEASTSKPKIPKPPSEDVRRPKRDENESGGSSQSPAMEDDSGKKVSGPQAGNEFVPARLPNFG